MSTELPALTPAPPRPSGAARSGPPLRAWGPILILVAAFVAGLVVVALVAALGASESVAESIAGVVLGSAILGGALLYWSLHTPHERRMIVGSKRHLGAAIGIGLAVGLGMRFVAGAIILLGDVISPGLQEEIEQLGEEAIPAAAWQKLLLVVGLVILAPFGEELLFRGLLLRGLARRMPFGWAAVISSALFGLVHLQYLEFWPVTTAVALFGLAAAWIYRWYGYPAAVAAHMLFNGIVAIVIFADPSRFTG
jgi:hypothetical protein